MAPWTKCSPRERGGLSLGLQQPCKYLDLVVVVHNPSAVQGQTREPPWGLQASQSGQIGELQTARGLFSQDKVESSGEVTQ